VVRGSTLGEDKGFFFLHTVQTSPGVHPASSTMRTRIFSRSKVYIFIDIHGSTAVLGLGLLYEVALSHSDTPYSAGLFWMSDRTAVETSTWQHTHHSKDTDVHAPRGIQTRNPSKRSAADPRLSVATGVGQVYFTCRESNDTIYHQTSAVTFAAEPHAAVFGCSLTLHWHCSSHCNTKLKY